MGTPVAFEPATRDRIANQTFLPYYSSVDVHMSGPA